MIQRYSHLQSKIKNTTESTLKILLQSFRCFEMNQFFQAKNLWLDHKWETLKVFEPCENWQERDAYGSDNRLFCEPLCRTSLARTEVRKSQKCCNVDCNVARRTAIYKTVRLPGLWVGNVYYMKQWKNSLDQVEQPAKQTLATFVVTPLFRRSLDIIHQFTVLGDSWRLREIYEFERKTERSFCPFQAYIRRNSRDSTS